jgi:hypothetical protein
VQPGIVRLPMTLLPPPASPASARRSLPGLAGPARPQPRTRRGGVLPCPKGPLTEALFAALRRPPHEVDPDMASGDGSLDDDGHLALYCCYELHYRGLPGVSEDWEWDPSLLALRRRLERRFEEDLAESVGTIDTDATRLGRDLCDLAAGGDGPSLSGWLLDHGTLGNAREFAMHRSAYQLKEADPHSWAIPRLQGEAKALMVTIQADEYGDGDAAAMHASLFADTLRVLGLDDTYHAYLDFLPGTTLATTNLISLFGLHRKWRGALVGHLALFEMTSVEPMGRYARLLERLGVTGAGRRFFDAHVEADQIHQHLAMDMVQGLVDREPELAPSVLFGARALCVVERQFAAHLLTSWRGGRSSMRQARVPA